MSRSRTLIQIPIIKLLIFLTRFHTTTTRQTRGPTREQLFKQNLQNFNRTLNDLWLSIVAHTGGPFNDGNCLSCSIVGAGNEFIHDHNPFPCDNTPDFYDQPPQNHVETYSCELCGNDSHYGYDCPPRFSLKTITLRDIISQLPSSIVITNSLPILPIENPEDSFIMGNEELRTIPKKESDKVIKSSVENLISIPSESDDTSGSDSEYDLPACDDFSPIDITKGKYVTFSNSLFDSNDDFTSSDDESLSDEDVPEDNVKIYSNPLFKFDDEYISSDVNPLFDEDECFDPGGDVDEINAFDIPSDFEDCYYDSEGDVLYLESLLSDDTTPNLPHGVFRDHDPRSLSEINDLKIMVKVFDPGILKKIFSPTYIPYGESKVHIEVLLVLWGYGLPIRTIRGRCLAKLATPSIHIGGFNVAEIQGLKEMYWEFVRDQGLRIKAKDTPPRLEASLGCYK
nr:hypothetical protein [Tanacetum cinerariifolium]